MAVSGTWNLVMKTPMGDRSATLVVQESGDALTGAMTSGSDSADIVDGTVQGDALAWKAAIQQPFPMTLEFSANVSGQEMSGKVKLGAFGDAPFQGVRA